MNDYDSYDVDARVRVKGEEYTGLLDLLFGSQDVNCKYVNNKYIGYGTQTIQCYNSKIIESISRAIAAASGWWQENCPTNVFIKKDIIAKGARRIGEALGVALEDRLENIGIPTFGIARLLTSWISEEIANYALEKVESIAITIGCSGDVYLTVKWS